jgi:hypothetical protein
MDRIAAIAAIFNVILIIVSDFHIYLHRVAAKWATDGFG